MSSSEFQYEVIAYKGSNISQSETLGKLNVLLQKVDDKFIPVDAVSFCKSKQVLVPSLFNSISENKLYRVKIKDSDRPIERDGDCKFVTVSMPNGSGDWKLDIEEVKPKDIIEVIKADLPDSNSRVFQHSRMPLTEYVFIDDFLTGFIYGPFSWNVEALNSDGYLIKLSWYNALFINRLDKNFTYKIDGTLIAPVFFENFFLNKADIYFINNTDNFLSKSSSKFEITDYASDYDIVEFGIEELKSIVRMNPNTLKSLQNNLKTNEFKSTLEQYFKQDKLSTPQKQRLSKFIKTISSTIPEEVYTSDLVDNFVYDIVSRDPDRYNVKDDAELSEIAEAQKKLNALNNELSNKDQDLQYLERKIKDLNSDLSKQSALDNSIKEKEVMINELEEKYSQESKKREENLNKLIESRQNELNEIQERLKIGIKVEQMKEEEVYLTKRLERLKDEQKTVINKLAADKSDLTKQLQEIKLFTDAINGSFTNSTYLLESRYIDCRELTNTEDNKRLFVNTIVKELRDNGRYYSDWQVLNLLICLQQSFITIFAGLPGTGKTSLARLITKVQQLEKRILEISVSRGWTSEKDLLGYYNPLTSHFQPSSTELYSFLKSLTNDSTVETNQAMAFVLLDEANLSPMEHYWSKFNAMTDTYNDDDKVLSISGSEKLNIPNYLRFIATINHDGTTELLSPRIIDRAPIIVLQESQDFLNIDFERVLDKLPLSANSMESFFGRSKTNNADFNEQEKRLFILLKDILNRIDSSLGLGVSISHRKESSMKEYCTQARSIMSSTSDLLAFDLAFLQFILPQIKGHGEKFINRMELLLSMLEEYDLKHSSEYLTRMLSFAKLEFGSIDFFCW